MPMPLPPLLDGYGIWLISASPHQGPCSTIPARPISPTRTVRGLYSRSDSCSVPVHMEWYVGVLQQLSSVGSCNRTDVTQRDPSSVKQRL